tara:strand:+ start:7 stop:3342 length:3336 start_codon:yes stop_codon:yes gene_type:complete
MDPNQQQLLLTSGGAKSDPVYVDDVYSTFLYKGNSNLGKLNYIANGIRLGTTNFGGSVNFETSQISYPDSADWDFGNGDFTVECWIRSKQGTNGYYTALGQWGSNLGWCIRYASQDIGTGWSFFFSTNGSNYFTAMGSDISDGNWHHVAVSRSGGYLRTYTDGVRNTNRSTTETFHNSSETFKLGGQSSGSNYFTGLLSNVRVIKGTALYTGASFTPPTEALTNVTNTVFLGCQSVIPSVLDPAAATVGGTGTIDTGDPKALAVGPFTGTEDARGGMVMTKARTAGDPWGVYSTTQGHTKVLSTTSGNAADTNAATEEMISFDANGFTLGMNANNAPNTNNQDTVAWTFAKQTGFFDIVTWTGDGVGGREIPHNLGSVPGCIIVKSTSTSGTDWRIYHRSMGNTKAISFTSAVASTNTAFWNDTSPTSTHFTVGTSLYINGSGSEFIAYVYAGGESTAATARSVDFDGSGDYLGFANTGSNGAYQLGTGDFTVEFWWKADSTTQGNWNQVIGTQSTGGTDTGLWRIGTRTNANKIYFSSATGGGFDEPAWDANIDDMQWHHVAITRASGYVYCYVDGVKLVNSGGTNNITRSLSTSNSLFIGYNVRDGNYINGQLSNVRIVKGTAVYTSSFNPLYEPLTDITNTTLLCCNNSSVTGGTVLPVVPTSYGNTAASTDSPFDDPEGYKFGADENKNIIKTGGYIGNGSATGPTVEIGWELQYLLIKNTVGGATQNWRLLDTARGFDYDGGYDRRLFPSQNSQESNASNIIDPNSRGFQLKTTDASVNGSGESYMYIAIRRPDGDVGKPVVAASKSFAIDYGNASGTIPSYNSGFPVDYGLEKYYNTTYDWWSSSRITGGTYVETSNHQAQSGPSADYVWDSMEGYIGGTWANSGSIAYMFRRGKGVDVVPYTGNGRQGRSVPHSLGQTPQMIWIKSRTSSTNWATGHIGLNGGTNPWNYYLHLDTTADQNLSFSGSDNVFWGDGAPSATHFSVGTFSSVNTSGQNYIAMLFADENDINDNPISKVGYFDGSDYANPINIGFSPRFFILKNIDATEYWPVHDTLRGFDKRLAINNANPQATTTGWVTPTASGVTLIGNQLAVNKAGNRYIYYAHA